MLFLQQRTLSRNNGADNGPLCGFRPLGALVDELIRRLWRQQHGARPCPLDPGRFAVIDGGRQ